ncbi:MAG TPA: hypothetical protein VGE15_10775 [Sphingobacteriaceae bacterium]
MRAILFTILLAMTSAFATADERTDVIVLGNNPSSISASIQAARSGVRTILISAGEPALTITPADTVSADPAGIWPEFIRRNQEKPGLSPAALVKNFTDTIKNLTIIRGEVKKIERAGKGWEVKLTNGRELKCQVLVDAGNHAASVEKSPATLSQRITETGIPADLYSSRLFRTSVATGPGLSDLIPIGALISKEENYIVAGPQGNTAASMLAGQAAGASAAYCAYFKTTTRSLQVRMTQGELLRYNGSLIPVQDVSRNDPAFIPVQHILATGILKLENGRFNPAGTINPTHLRLPLKEYFSRSQIWFLNHKKDTLTIGDAVDLIMFTATRGEELRREIESGWSSSLKLQGTYDPKRVVTRLELAVLIDRFLKPFGVNVDFAGRLVR